MHAISNPDVKLVTLQGVAGTGKTLLALAGALEQRRQFKQIYLARPIVPLSNKDIGYLPGDIKEKINPYMEPLWDNLKFIKNQYNENDKEFKAVNIALESEKLVITGCVTNMCVLYTAAGAVFRGYRVNIVKDAVIGLNLKDHKYALEHMKVILKVNII